MPSQHTQGGCGFVGCDLTWHGRHVRWWSFGEYVSKSFVLLFDSNVLYQFERALLPYRNFCKHMQNINPALHTCPPGNSVFTRLSVGLELKGHSPVFSLNLSGAWSPQGESDSPSHPSLMFLFAQLINPPTPIHLLPSTQSVPLWNWYQYASLFSHQKFTSLPPVLD